MQAFYTINTGSSRYEGRTWTIRDFCTCLVDEKDSEKIMESLHGPNWKDRWIPMEIPTLTSADLRKREFKRDAKEMKEKYGSQIPEPVGVPEPLPSLYSVAWSNYGYETRRILIYSDCAAAAIKCACEFHELFAAVYNESGYGWSVNKIDMPKPITLQWCRNQKVEGLKETISFAQENIARETRKREETEREMRELLANHDKRIGELQDSIRKHEEELARFLEENPEPTS